MSQCSRVLDVLRDGKPHSIQEIHERAGTMRLNSRVADLRRLGFNIAYYRKDGLHTYQLLPEVGVVQRGEGSGERTATSRLTGPSRRMDDGSARHAGLVVAPPTPEPQSQPVRQLSVFEAVG